MATMEINGLDYEITGTAPDGLPIIKAAEAKVIKQGFDEDGNPKQSVVVNVAPIQVGVIPGKNGE